MRAGEKAATEKPNSTETDRPTRHFTDRHGVRLLTFPIQSALQGNPPTSDDTHYHGWLEISERQRDVNTSHDARGRRSPPDQNSFYRENSLYFSFRSAFAKKTFASHHTPFRFPSNGPVAIVSGWNITRTHPCGISTMCSP